MHQEVPLNSGQVATLLGLSRNTVGRWLATYATGSLPALLQLYIPAGKRPAPAPDVLASIEQVLHQPADFSSYVEVRRWVERTPGRVHQVQDLVQPGTQALPR